jgi:hypothetical protein
MAEVQLQNIEKRYDNEAHAVRGVSFVAFGAVLKLSDEKSRQVLTFQNRRRILGYV